MATAGDDCNVCKDILKAPRVLHCNHVFCLDCLEKLERNKNIVCPLCKEDTKIPEGLLVRHLKRQRFRSHTAKTPKTKLIKSWKVEHQITDVTIDDETGVLYLATGDKDKPIKAFDLTGDYSGHLSADVGLVHARLGLDTKRGLLLAAKTAPDNAAIIVMFDREGMQIGIIRCPEFKELLSIAYHRSRDVYIVADTGAHCLYYINPNNYKVVKTIPAANNAEIQGDMFISCNKSGQVSVWASADWRANTVRLYDSDGSCIKVWNNQGSGYGQFNNPGGVYVDTKGRILVSCTGRIIRLDPECIGESGEWQIVVNTGQFGLGRPRMIDMTEDGLAAVVMWDKPPGPYNLMLINGLT